MSDRYATARPIVVTDVFGTIQHLNAGAMALLSRHAAYLIGRPLQVFIAEVDRGDLRKRVRELYTGAAEQFSSWRLTIQPPLAPAHRVLASVTKYLSANGTAHLRWEFVETEPPPGQVSELVQTHAQIFARMSQAVFVADADQVIWYANPALDRLFGMREGTCIGRPLRELFASADLQPTAMLEALNSGSSWTDEVTFTHGGARLMIRVQISSIEVGGQAGWLALLEDVTEQRRAEQSYREQQAQLSHVLRLQMLAEMASGLAHELNQPLSAIANYAKGCMYRLDKQDISREQLREVLGDISEQALRAGAIVSRMRRFVRRTDPQRVPADVNDIIRDTLRFIEREAHEQDVVAHIHLAEGLPRVLVDPIQIQQVLLNFLRNAIEAMRESSTVPSELTVESRRKDAVIEVVLSDTGPGLPAGLEQQVFDPFVTTKSSGLGMGLTISRSIVEAHGGALSAASLPDCGARFSFTLPIPQVMGRIGMPLA